MRFEEALKAMREGKKVKLTVNSASGHHDRYYFIKDGELVYTINQDTWEYKGHLYSYRIMSETWEIADIKLS